MADRFEGVIMGARTPVSVPANLLGRTPWSIAGRLEALLVAVSFWAAMGLPVVYFSLLVSGIDSRADLGLFLVLLGLHSIALIVGHGYQATSR